MTHFVGIVIADDEDQLEQILSPYDEGKPSVPYFVPVRDEATDNWNEFEAMCRQYGTDDPQKLLEHVEDWCGAPGEIKDGVLGYYSTYNQDSKWDWYEVGGRWDGVVPNNQCLAEEVIGHFEKNTEAKDPYIPSVLVDKKGWHTTKDWGWWGTSREVEGQENIVEQKLSEHKGKLVYIVDFHI